jgi:hypothetical protein
MGKIIKLTKQIWESIDNTKTGADNLRLKSTDIILFNTTQLIKAEAHIKGGTRITYKEAMVNGFTVAETLEEIQILINK